MPAPCEHTGVNNNNNIIIIIIVIINIIPSSSHVHACMHMSMSAVPMTDEGWRRTARG
jgi:hypothetical protein